MGVGAAATQGRRPTTLHLGLVTRQDVAPRRGCEDDTVVEPDVAVSPVDPDVAIAVAHDCRFADGGAVTISAAWTHDGGATWHHQPVQGLTQPTGHRFDRASDPVVAFGPDGTAYLSVLVISTKNCPNSPNEVVVLRSSNGGRTWSKPFVAHRDPTCRQADDKNWLVIDTSPDSPHYGRLYQFWTNFLSSDVRGEHFIGAPQEVRWSDDRGETWSKAVYVTARRRATQNSQPMIAKDGTIVDTYYDYGATGVRPEAAKINAFGPIYASVSTDGGATWHRTALITENGGGYAPAVRCCLFAADIDPVTGTMYVAYEGGAANGHTDPVFLQSSRNARNWTAPVQVSEGDRRGVQRVNVDVVARAGSVFVSYGTRTPANNGGFVQQQLSVSHDGGVTFLPPLSLGPRSVLRYAARAGGYFPGDYIGSALTRNRLYVVWARSSRPPASSSSRFHQVILGATLRP